MTQALSQQIPHMDPAGRLINSPADHGGHLKAPFPAFGGKRQAAPLAWSRLGDVRNYVEPFAFSAAVLLSRPHPGQVETINDLNHFVCNFWRAVRADPEAVAAHADHPVIEDDMHARHRWLVYAGAARAALARVRDDPDAYDAKIAGWWAWGACCWIGSGWCDAHAGSNSAEWNQIPEIQSSRGVNGNAGRGVLAIQRPVLESRGVQGRPQLADAFARGRGVNGHDAAGTCEQRRAWLTAWMLRLADRLRPVRVCCGHWDRVCDSESTLTRLGLTGVFLDPPYRKTLPGCGTANRNASLYANDATQDVDALCDQVQAWCLKWGGDPQIRVALCGLDGEYPELDAAGWDKVAWKSRGGYGNRTARGRENAGRERIWFNAACLKPDAPAQLCLPGMEAHS